MAELGEREANKARTIARGTVRNNELRKLCKEDEEEEEEGLSHLCEGHDVLAVELGAPPGYFGGVGRHTVVAHEVAEVAD